MRPTHLSVTAAPCLGVAMVAASCAFDWDELDPRRQPLAEGGGSVTASSVTTGGAGGTGGGEVTVCGDGMRTPDEQCDDGNLDNGDGCSDRCTVECDQLFDPESLHCYDVSADTVTEAEAAAECTKRGPGWTLAAISTEVELTWLSKQPAINDVFDSSPFIWLGGSDADLENTFTWNNGETPFPTELFIPGQPDNNGDEDCVDFWRTSGDAYGLNDDLCGRAFPYLCERAPVGR